MDPSAANGFGIKSVATGASPAGKLSWNDDHTVLSFNPTERLAVHTQYTVTLEKGLKGAHGGVTANGRTSTFTTIAPPSVAQTYPADGAKDAGRFGFSIQFATPMDPATLENKIRISGFTAADLENRVYTSEQQMGVNVSFKASRWVQ